MKNIFETPTDCAAQQAARSGVSPIKLEGVGQSGRARFSIFEANSSSDPNRVEANGDIVPLSKWTHLALSYTAGGFARGYIDGVEQFSVASIGNQVGSSFDIGHDPFDSASQRFWGGKIDDVRIYNHQLTTAEIEALAPEPATLVLMGLGLAGIGYQRRRNVSR